MSAIKSDQVSAGRAPPSIRLVEHVADYVGVDHHVLPPLYDAIDPDALDTLCQSDNPNSHVTFTYAGFEVTVSGDGAIELDMNE